MSKEVSQDESKAKKDSDHNDKEDDHENENSEASGSRSNNSVRQSNEPEAKAKHGLRNDIDGHVVQPDDGIARRELPDEMRNAQDMDNMECSTESALSEFPMDSEDSEENNDSLHQAYLDTLNAYGNIPTLKLNSTIDIRELDYTRMIQNEDRVKPNPVGPRKILEKKASGSKSKSTKGLKNKEIKTGTISKISTDTETEKNPGKAVYDYVNSWPKTSSECLLFDNNEQQFKCPDYGSDEFADVEDNAIGSSSEDTSTSEESECKENMQAQSALPEASSRQKIKEKDSARSEFTNEEYKASECFFGKGLKEKADTVLQQKGPVDIFSIGNKTDSETSCSHSKDLPGQSEFPPNVGTPMPVKSTKPAMPGKNAKPAMPTIVETPEKENGQDDHQASTSQPNQLKMRPKVSSKTIKCNTCEVRLGLCGIQCRCGNYYCSKHRYANEHNCPFDYRTMGAEEIRRNNPKVIAEKVRKL